MAERTDMELLTLAAKAAGMAQGWIDAHVVNSGMWNPLTDSGQALELAVKLRCLVDIEAGYAKVLAPNQSSDDFYESRVRLKPDPYAATRRAIVDAAAFIGAAL